MLKVCGKAIENGLVEEYQLVCDMYASEPNCAGVYGVCRACPLQDRVGESSYALPHNDSSIEPMLLVRVSLREKLKPPRRQRELLVKMESNSDDNPPLLADSKHPNIPIRELPLENTDYGFNVVAILNFNVLCK